MLRLNSFGIVIFLTYLPPVANFWFFSCRHGNGNGDLGDPCWAWCQCRSPNTCEAGVQRCVAPGKLNDPCHLTRPCGKGLSCHPGVQKCYHVPRRLYEPCVAGFECGSGLSCQPGIQVCFHALRRYNEPCIGGHPCGPGLSCQPGAQRCLHFPRLENERCSLGFECGAGLECTLCAEPYLTCQLSRIPNKDEEFYRRPYNKVAFLVTHNAFSNSIQYAVWVRNQRVSVAQQLRDGVRGLMLDIYPGWGQAEVRLCHANCFWGGSTNLLDTLIQIRDFLDTHPREVVTVIFEDYLRNPTILKRVFDQAGVSSHVLSSDFWGSGYRDWPTLDDMHRLGRLVVFNNNGLEGFPYTVYNMWYYVRENRYGQKGLDTKTCVDRAESEYNAHYNNNWSLVLINWFGTIPNPLDPCLNSFPKLKEKLNTCQRAFGQLANFVAVDFYHDGEKGGAFKAVEGLNQQWKDKFPTENETLSEENKSKYEHFQNEKTSILDNGNQNITEINGILSTKKNISTNPAINHVTSKADHVINATNKIINTTIYHGHQDNASSQSLNWTNHVIDVKGHWMNVTDHVMGNISNNSVTMETPVHNDTIIRFSNITYSMDINRRGKLKRLQGAGKHPYSVSKGVVFFTNESQSNGESWEKRININDSSDNINVSTLGSKLLHINATTLTYKTKNNTGTRKMLTTKIGLDSATNRSKTGGHYEEGILIGDKLLHTTEFRNISKVTNGTKKEVQAGPRMLSYKTTKLQTRNNRNSTKGNRFLKEDSILNLKSKNGSQQGHVISLNTTNFDSTQSENYLRKLNASLRQSNTNELESLFDPIFPARNVKTTPGNAKNDKMMEQKNTMGNETVEKSTKQFWNLPGNNSHKNELLEEIDDIRKKRSNQYA